ncbi:cereblon family protein [Haliangium ochraceum]|uniref:CULT domain-containing protein n=1 Tax=Haliangium ochraceum (strain DSM 14365 / JCM 11303 / SMP-2) TaxID=502025 RepID=D0LRK7_HALO1|nr:cereblon family protein [Haliangium ochraceum]ACY18999.1 hypothetical protein Hoch_6530 [Haliangium ochraceum DSM 14365]
MRVCRHGIARQQWCLDGAAAERGSADAAAARERGARERPRALLCAACRQRVTATNARVERGGQHEHLCTNPHGFAYHIGCFAAAPGCVAAGAAERGFSWFPGYAWQIAVCRGCWAHLGWRFGAGGDRFHGLILNRLVEEEGPGDSAGD